MLLTRLLSVRFSLLLVIAMFSSIKETTGRLFCGCGLYSEAFGTSEGNFCFVVAECRGA